MIELVILDENFDILGIVDGFNSLIWTRKYYDTGSFELHAPADCFGLLKSGKYLYCASFRDAGIILTVKYKRDSNGKREVIAKGRFLDWLLEDRVFEAVYNYSGAAENVMRGMVSAKAIQARPITGLKLGANHNLGTQIMGQVTGKQLRETLYSICEEQELSIRVLLDYDTNDLVFEAWQGLDRTDSQAVNSWAIFSDDFENLSTSEAEYDDSEYKNVAYVAGEGEDTDRIVVEVDMSGDEERREMFVDARDIRKTVDNVTMSDAEYRALLNQRGREKLGEHPRRCSVEGEAADSKALIYGIDYDLGDKVVYVDHDVGIAADDRITEIKEVFEKNSHRVDISFGKQALTIRQLVKREAG